MVFGVSRGQCDLTAKGYHHIKADISDESAVREMMATIADQAGRLDVLINNAGQKTNGYALLTTSSQATEMVMTNLLGTFLMTREAAKLMKRNRLAVSSTFPQWPFR